MEIPISTKKSFGRAAQIEATIASFEPKSPELEFPVDPEFNPQPRHLDPVAMYWRCEELVRQGARKHDRQQRDAESFDVEFVM